MIESLGAAFAALRGGAADSEQPGRISESYTRAGYSLKLQFQPPAAGSSACGGDIKAIATLQGAPVSIRCRWTRTFGELEEEAGDSSDVYRTSADDVGSVIRVECEAQEPKFLGMAGGSIGPIPIDQDVMRSLEGYIAARESKFEVGSKEGRMRIEVTESKVQVQYVEAGRPGRGAFTHAGVFSEAFPVVDLHSTERCRAILHLSQGRSFDLSCPSVMERDCLALVVRAFSARSRLLTQVVVRSGAEKSFRSALLDDALATAVKGQVDAVGRYWNRRFRGLVSENAELKQQLQETVLSMQQMLESGAAAATDGGASASHIAALEARNAELLETVSTLRQQVEQVEAIHDPVGSVSSQLTEPAEFSGELMAVRAENQGLRDRIAELKGLGEENEKLRSRVRQLMTSQ